MSERDIPISLGEAEIVYILLASRSDGELVELGIDVGEANDLADEVAQYIDLDALYEEDGDE